MRRKRTLGNNETSRNEMVNRTGDVIYSPFCDVVKIATFRLAARLMRRNICDHKIELLVSA